MLGERFQVSEVELMTAGVPADGADTTATNTCSPLGFRTVDDGISVKAVGSGMCHSNTSE